MNYGQFQILKELTRGSAGVLYQAFDTLLCRSVALKVLPPSIVADTPLAKGFFGELKVIGGLSHPNIAVVHSIGEEQGRISPDKFIV